MSALTNATLADAGTPSDSNHHNWKENVGTLSIGSIPESVSVTNNTAPVFINVFYYDPVGFAQGVGESIMSLFSSETETTEDDDADKFDPTALAVMDGGLNLSQDMNDMSQGISIANTQVHTNGQTYNSNEIP